MPGGNYESEIRNACAHCSAIRSGMFFPLVHDNPQVKQTIFYRTIHILNKNNYYYSLRNAGAYRPRPTRAHTSPSATEEA
jgi:hypothetical protein